MSTNGLSRLWGIEDVAAFLGVPVETVRSWRKKNYGPPARKLGKHLRWDPIKVRDWFEALGEEDAA